MTLLLGILIVIWVVIGLLMLLGELGIVTFLPFSLMHAADQTPVTKVSKKVDVQSKPKVVKEVEKEVEKDEDAIKRSLNDKTIGGYAGRKTRILEKKNKK
jgi:hypothetical protein